MSAQSEKRPQSAEVEKAVHGVEKAVYKEARKNRSQGGVWVVVGSLLFLFALISFVVLLPAAASGAKSVKEFLLAVENAHLEIPYVFLAFALMCWGFGHIVQAIHNL